MQVRGWGMVEMISIIDIAEAVFVVWFAATLVWWEFFRR